MKLYVVTANMPDEVYYEHDFIMRMKSYYHGEVVQSRRLYDEYQRTSYQIGDEEKERLQFFRPGNYMPRISVPGYHWVLDEGLADELKELGEMEFLEVDIRRMVDFHTWPPGKEIEDEYYLEEQPGMTMAPEYSGDPAQWGRYFELIAYMPGWMGEPRYEPEIRVEFPGHEDEYTVPSLTKEVMSRYPVIHCAMCFVWRQDAYDIVKSYLPEPYFYTQMIELPG